MLLRIALIAIGLALLVGAGWYARPSEAGPGGIKISLDPSSPAVPLSEPFVVGLDIANVSPPGLGTWIVDVTYDPDMVTAESCTPQQSTGCGIFDTNVRFNGSTLDGLTGDLDFGTITFRGDAEGVTPLGIDVLGISDVNSTDLTIALLINGTSVTITSGAATATPTDEPLPGLDDTATPTPTPTGPTPSPTITATPSVTPTPTVQEVAGLLVIARLDNTPVPLENWEVNVFAGDACLGLPIASGVTDSRGEFSVFGLPLGPYSVSQKLPSGWISGTALCQDVLVHSISGPLELNVVVFRNVPVANGDVNSDDATNSLDSLIVLQFDVGLVLLEDLDLFGQFRADVNLDFSIDAIDAALILQFDAGLLDSLPVGGGGSLRPILAPALPS